MRKIWLAMLVSIFLLALTGPGANAVDGPALSTDGVAVSVLPVSSYTRYEFPLTVTEDGKVTFRFYGGLLSVLDAKGATALWQASGDKSIYLHKGAYTARIVSSYSSASIGLSATVEKRAADAEPNDTASTAQQVSLPGSLKGIVGMDSDKDSFKFTVGARTGMTFGIASEDQYFPVSFNLYNAGGQRIKDLTVAQKVALNAGGYYLIVNRLANSSGDLPYTTAYTISAASFRCVDSLTVSPAEATLEVNQTRQLSLTALPANHEETVSYSSSNPSVATVTGGGLVRAVKAGTATITCTVPSGASAQAVITVLKPVAASYKLPKTFKATRGFTYLMDGWLKLPSGTRAPGNLKWTSSKKSVATVTPEGVLTCKKTGKTTITAVNSKGKKFKTTLTVISNQLKNAKPKGKKGYISTYPKRVYYKGGSLYIEVFLFNNTKYNLRTDIYEGYVFELYDLAKSTESPVLRRNVSWNPGRIKKRSWKVFKITLDRALYDNCDLGLGQLYPVVYTEDDFYAVKGIPSKAPLLRRALIDPRRTDEPSDFS